MDILITGGTGFLGKVVCQELTKNGHHLSLISRESSTMNTSTDCLLDLSTTVPSFSKESFEAVVHVAGKAHVVPRTKTAAEIFYKENVAITRNLLDGLDKLERKPKFFVFISSVAVYGLEHGCGITEDAPLLANDAYGKSKIESERLIQKWCTANEITLTISRLPLIAGDNPPGNLGAMINAIQKGYYVRIGSGGTKRSIVLATDVARATHKLFQIGGIYNLTDAKDAAFVDLERALKVHHSITKPTLVVPNFVARVLAKVGDLGGSMSGKNLPFNSNKLSKITNDLTFSTQKAVNDFGWSPQSVLDYYSTTIK